MVGFKKGSRPWNKGKKTGIVPRFAFKKGQKPHNKKEKIKLYCLMCKKEYSLKPSAAFRIGDKEQYRTKYCSAKCRQDSFKYNENVKRKATENIHRYLRSSKKGQ